jgi:hypothetical protein
VFKDKQVLLALLAEDQLVLQDQVVLKEQLD